MSLEDTQKHMITQVSDWLILQTSWSRLEYDKKVK